MYLNCGIKIFLFFKCGKSGQRVGTDINTPEFIKDYKFYLAFENSLCVDYLTEKFYKGFPHEVIPVVRGASIR